MVILVGSTFLLPVSHWLKKSNCIFLKIVELDVSKLLEIVVVSAPLIVFNTHLDTVPPYIPPTEDKMNIYGRGSNDAKGQLACMISAAKFLVESHPAVADRLALLFVVGEEVDHIGMTKANDFVGLNPDYLIVGEPTEMKFATIQKGALKVIVRCKGIAGHSGYPSQGKSAIHMLIPVLNDILNYEWPSDAVLGSTTVNIGIIEGGQAQNAWAENAHARIFFRVTTSVADIQGKLECIVGGIFLLVYKTWMLI
ncbi:unnamed protein product [Angiostrongylus costaricensis]|uniref:M20_dimer domain-containing protein n=1 Tax=Angiostrongylus costaricensis TaxID=334426 RepID=A0A158PHH5_ANGCS|nr:unnamed protein product [Angiostrongylus costaricensis]